MMVSFFNTYFQNLVSLCWEVYPFFKIIKLAPQTLYRVGQKLLHAVKNILGYTSIFKEDGVFLLQKLI